MRPPGYALKVGQLVANIISSINDVAGLHAAPLTLVDVLKCMDDGKAILANMQTASDVRTLAQAAVDSVAVVGPACRSGVTGILASPNRQGTLRQSVNYLVRVRNMLDAAKILRPLESLACMGWHVAIVATMFASEIQL